MPWMEGQKRFWAGNINLGWQPMAPALRAAVAALVPKREPDELVVVHHFTDHGDRLQLEIERRSETLGIHFERMFL